MEKLIPPPESIYTYTKADLDYMIESVKKDYEIKLRGLTHDLDEMRKLYQKAEDKLRAQEKNAAGYMRRIRELKDMNRQLMKLYYNETTGRDIEED